MKYSFLPKMMWAAFCGTFTEALADVLNVTDPKSVMKSAHRKYREILLGVDEFDKGDRFLINILSAAMFSSVLLSLSEKPTVGEARQYYRTAMNENFFMRKAAKKSKNFTVKGREKLKADAVRSQSCANPYSWRFTVEDGETIDEYTAVFYTCGICHLMNGLGLAEYIPSLCSYDYDMAALNRTKFRREYTLASGGPYCDCHYDHRKDGGADKPK